MKSEESFVRRPLDLSSAQVARGQVYIIPGRCKGCGYCIEFCPKGVLTESQDINPKGYHYAIVAEKKGIECIHCQFCNLVCPEMAIYTEEITDDGKESVHDDERQA